MRTYKNALPHIASFCLANPGQTMIIAHDQVHKLGLNVVKLTAWAEENKLTATFSDGGWKIEAKQEVQA